MPGGIPGIPGGTIPLGERHEQWAADTQRGDAKLQTLNLLGSLRHPRGPAQRSKSAGFGLAWSLPVSKQSHVVRPSKNF